MIVNRTSGILLMISFLMAFNISGWSQTGQQDVMLLRLCKTWKIEKMLNGTSLLPLDETPGNFVMIISEDKTVLQGIQPDGYIKGTWEFNTQTMMLTIKDDYTSGVYPMKILTLTSDQLVLEDSRTEQPLTIFYRTQ